MVAVGGACVAVVAVHIAHERLVAQGSWGTVQMEVVMVDRHELPVEVWTGKVVGGAAVVCVSVWKVDIASVVVVASRSVSRSRVSN